MNQTLAQNPGRPEDIFDLDASATDAKQAATQEGHQQPTGTAAKKTIVDHLASLKTGHLAVIVGTILAAALAYNHIRRDAPAVRPHEAQYIDPNAAPETPQAPPQARSTPASAPALAPATAPTQAKASAEPAPALQAQADNTAPTTQVTDSERGMIRNALTDLNARLSILEQQAASQSTQAPRQPARVAASAPVRPSKLGGRPPQRPDTTSLVGYKLNTIFQDQAWIDHDGRTYLVQAGDHIGELRIVSIDARARRVLTSNGTIN